MAKKILYIDVGLVDNVVTHWREGGLAAMPTETVYGLGADATNGQAVARIYSVKSRPQFNPLIVHVSDIETAKRYVQWNAMAELLAAKFWPGPMTLVLKKRHRVPGDRWQEVHELVSAGGDTLAIRIPAHPIALQLLRAYGGGIAAPSANRSGRVSPTTAQHVRDELGDDVAVIIDGGACEVGLESTVIDLSGEHPMILRPGAVTAQMIAQELGIGNCGIGNEAALDNNTQSPIPNPSLKSPGQLASHYAPSIPVRLNVSAVTAEEALLAFGDAPLLGAAKTLNLSERGDLIEAAANLFAHLRALDDAAYEAIAVMPIPNIGVGVAINDRLNRAGAPK